jgi:hypothetical protein
MAITDIQVTLITPSATSIAIRLFLFDVDADEPDVRESLTEHREDGADSAADLEQASSALERGAVADQPISPVLGLLDEPLLLARAVAMNVAGHSSSLGRTPVFADPAAFPPTA